MDPHVLRYSPGLEGIDVARMARLQRTAIIEVEIVARFAGAPHRYARVQARVYGRDMPPDRERRGLPLSLARGGAHVWHLETAQLLPDWPHASFVIVGVPEPVGDVLALSDAP